MGRLAPRVANAFAFAALALVITIAATLPARSQTLATLHVRTFTMKAEPTAIRVGDSFRLTIAAHVDELVNALDNVTLPNLIGFDVTGDSRSCVASSQRGSDCSETIELRANVSGDFTVPAAIMDAVDGRNGKPSRFSSNTVFVRVAPPPPRIAGWILDILWALVLASLPVFAGAFVIYVLFRRFGERRPVVRPEPIVPIVIAPPVDRDAILRSLVATLANERTRSSAVAVRAALRERVGAREDETLADIARRYRNGARASQTFPHFFTALAAIERAAFCEDRNVPHAIEEALPSLNF